MTSPSRDLISALVKVSNAVGVASNAKRRPDLVSVLRLNEGLVFFDYLYIFFFIFNLGCLQLVSLETGTPLFAKELSYILSSVAPAHSDSLMKRKPLSASSVKVAI